MKVKLKKGDAIFYRKHSHYQSKNPVISPEITKIGRLYFYCGDDKFSIKTMKEALCSGSGNKVFFSEKALLDEDEAKILQFNLSETLNKRVYGALALLPLDDLKEIKAIIERSEDEKHT